MSVLRPLALVADGHADCRQTLALALELAGWRVAMVPNGPQALAWLREWTPQAIVLDARLPLVRGLDVARVVRANVRLDDTRVVLTHTWLDQPPTRRMAALGIDSAWVKPFDTCALMRDLERPRRGAAAPRA